MKSRYKYHVEKRIADERFWLGCYGFDFLIGDIYYALIETDNEHPYQRGICVAVSHTEEGAWRAKY